MLKPDSLTGAILAIEGIEDAAVLLNGPTGCKFYHGAISEDRFPRATSYDPMQYQEEFYFGQPRVPATYLDNDDYVFGSTHKLESMLPKIATRGHSCIAIINSPGAALIGDDLAGFATRAELPMPVIIIESTGYSGTMAEGWSHGVTQMLACLDPGDESSKQISTQPIINLIGLSLYDRYWEGDRSVLIKLLNCVGIQVQSVLSAGDRVSDVAGAKHAKLNVVLHPEGGETVAKWMQQRWNTPYIAPALPVGFNATESWLTAICTELNIDPTPGLNQLQAQRERAIMRLKPFHGLTGYPKGLTFAVTAEQGLCEALTTWLESWLGMVPIHKLGGTPAQADVLLADGAMLTNPDTLANPQASLHEQVQIEIALPTRGHIDMIPKALLGGEGALYLLEWIINGVDQVMHRRTVGTSVL